MISPYLAEESRRLATRNPAPAPTPKPAKLIVSSNAEYRASDYRFGRRQTDPAPLQKTRPVESTATRLKRFAMIALIFASLWAATSGLAWLLTSQ